MELSAPNLSPFSPHRLGAADARGETVHYPLKDFPVTRREVRNLAKDPREDPGSQDSPILT